MDYTALRKELQQYYWNEVNITSEAFREKCEKLLDKKCPDASDINSSAYQLKIEQYRVIADEFEPKIFKNSPFYYEMGTMSAHCDGAGEFRGHKHAGGWLRFRRSRFFIEQDEKAYEQFETQLNEKMYLVCGKYCDELQHFAFNHRPILNGGLKSVYDQAKKSLKTAKTQEEKEFLQSLCEGYLCLKKISEKFADKAEKILAIATDEQERARLHRIIESARYVPWNAPRSFYEALNAYMLLRKAVGALEGVGVNSFGRLDMDLYPFYEQDIASGALTKEGAYALIECFLLTWDCHYDHDMKMVGYADHELENTYTLGGCDEKGKTVYNDLTQMFLRATREHKIIFPKIKCRIALDSPKEYLDEINADVIKGTSSVLYSNDEAIIPALIRAGRTEQEARDYIQTGCWGLLTQGTEKPDGGSYFNLLKVFEFALHDRADKMRKIGVTFDRFDGARSFEEVYQTLLENVRRMLESRAGLMKNGRGICSKINPLPVFSSTIESCIKNKKDYTCGGAKYNDDNVLFVGFPNVVDSLLAIQQLCFVQKKYTLAQFLTAVRANWEGCEHIRQDALKCNFWGDESKDSCALANRFNNDLYALTKDMTTLYGGKTVMGHLTYTEIKTWAADTLATPDGRKAGEYFSQGLTPSRLRHISSVTSVLNSMRGLDASTWAMNTVINVILPSNKITLGSCESFLRALMRCNVQSLQLNCTTKEELLDAQIHPEAHKDLIVRVCGFSARFTALSRAWQDEFLSRNFYE